MFDGILFDLDGTLWDSTPVMVEIWADILPRHPELSRPPVLLDEIRGNMGLLLEDIAVRMFPGISEDAAKGVLKEFNEENERRLAVRGGSLFPGTVETLEALAARSRLFVVSNCQDGYIESFYSGNGLGRFFAGSECAGRTGLPKSENIKLVVERYGLKSPVYIGDTMLDYTSAVDAGVPFLHAAYGFGTVPGVPAVGTFADIPAALETMSSTPT